MMTSKKRKGTPLNCLYHTLKQQYPLGIVLFRLGSRYETFEADARIIEKVLQLTLTSPAPSSALRGFPSSEVRTYSAQLIQAGYTVIICEQQKTAGEIHPWARPLK